MSSTRRKTTPPTDDELADRLRAAGLRRTEPRVAVLRYMCKVDRPLAHAEVAATLGKQGLDRVSVYRVLVDLARAKILSRTDMGDHVWRFGLLRGGSSHAMEHPHFVCVSCGSVACLPEAAVQLSARAGHAAPRAVRKRKVEVQLKGECDTCLRTDN